MNFCIAGYLRIKSSPNNAIWFIKTNFLEAIKYFRLSIGAIVLRSFYPCGLSKLKKKGTWMPKRSLYTCMTTCMNHEATDSIYDPLKQTKKALWCFTRLTINSVSGCFRCYVSVEVSCNKWNVWKGIPVFLVGKFQAEIRISCLQTVFKYYFQAFEAVFR